MRFKRRYTGFIHREYEITLLRRNSIRPVHRNIEKKPERSTIETWVRLGKWGWADENVGLDSLGAHPISVELGWGVWRPEPPFPDQTHNAQGSLYSILSETAATYRVGQIAKKPRRPSIAFASTRESLPRHSTGDKRRKFPRIPVKSRKKLRSHAHAVTYFPLSACGDRIRRKALALHAGGRGSSPSRSPCSWDSGSACCAETSPGGCCHTAERPPSSAIGSD